MRITTHMSKQNPMEHGRHYFIDGVEHTTLTVWFSAGSLRSISVFAPDDRAGGWSLGPEEVGPWMTACRQALDEGEAVIATTYYGQRALVVACVEDDVLTVEQPRADAQQTTRWQGPRMLAKKLLADLDRFNADGTWPLDALPQTEQTHDLATALGAPRRRA